MAAPHDDAEVSDPLKSGGAPEPPCRNPGGRPPHQPTEEARRHVQRMAGDGLTHAQIARVVRLGETTLKRHYAEELARGAALATATVGRSLFRMATDWMTPGEDGRPRAPDRAAVAAAIFWMKARAGWSERVKVEHSGDQDSPLAVLLTRPPDELERRQREIDAALAAIEAAARRSAEAGG